jgi:integrase
LEQERRLRQELELRHRSGQTIDKGKYGWLGRWPIQPKVAQKTINYELQCLQTFLQWAIRQNYLFSNPASAIEHFRIPKKSIPKFVTSDDLKRFFDACNPEERRIFATMLLTGMRKGEMENLTWEDVQFELSIIFIQAKKDWNPKSDERIIPKFQVMRHSNASLGGIRTRKKAVLY